MKTLYFVAWIAIIAVAMQPENNMPETLLARTYYEYLFDGNLNESKGRTALKPLGKGDFSMESFANCGKKHVYNFAQNCGFVFNNHTASNFFGKEYTIELYFKFKDLTSWKRIVEYKSRRSDTGPYSFNNQIQFYNITPSPSFPFSVDTYAHVVLSRSNSGLKTYNMYVDGNLRISFNDLAESGVLDENNLLNFFQDDLEVGGEASAGSIALLRLYNYVLTQEEVKGNFATLPCPLYGK